MFDAFAFAGLRPATPPGAGGTFHGFRGHHEGRRIDHIFVTDDIEVVRAEIVHTAAWRSAAFRPLAGPWQSFAFANATRRGHRRR